MKKNRLYTAILMAAALAATSCSDFTDIKPKGKNLLSTTDELELLFNNDIDISLSDVYNIGGGVVSGANHIPSELAMPNKERSTLLWSYSDTPADIQRIQQLTSSDGYYSSCYKWVGRICNPVINNASMASGSEQKKAALVAEAKALRSYAHFLLVNKFAKAYDPATASTDGGVIYMTEDKSIDEIYAPSTVAKVYEQCLRDVNDAINSGALPTVQPTKTRFNLPAAYALKANILMCMQQYTEAAEAAEAALQIEGGLDDYYANVRQEPRWLEYIHMMPNDKYDCFTSKYLETAENYFVVPNYLLSLWVEPDFEDQIEPKYGHYFLNPRIKEQYKGFYEILAGGMTDQSTNMIGLRDWDSPDNMPGMMEYHNVAGLATPQMYILLAECYVRGGDIDKGMDQLDHLRQFRLPADTYAPLKGTVTDEAAAIERIKQTSLGENIWTVWNFIQRKRWNVQPEWQTTLTHDFGDNGIHTLSPTSNLWVFPFPLSVIQGNPNVHYNYNN
ncbi:MAG: RagB/SusD family nutrient uptake outer membrane protein [Bacteroidaceae bacterium]|nr:RagB/SusD family nutrient uptake outer membrane protein [Bacteroidaceae bacterium]